MKTIYKKTIFILLFSAAFAVAPFLASADEEIEPSDLANRSSDFTLSYEFLDETNSPIQRSIDGIATVRILADAKLERDIYTMTLYIDNSYVLKLKNIRLPYDFKWNFKGLSDGGHKFVFILNDFCGRIGILKMDIQVEH